MAYNGSGTFNLVSGNPVVTGTTISSTWANSTLSDIATGLSNVLCKDGQSTPTANLPMGNYKFTGLAAGTSNGDSVRYEQATSAVAITGGTINGATIGATTASTGAFTTLSASSTISGAGFSTYLASPPAIGGTTANTVKGTTVTATTNYTFPDSSTQNTAATGFGFKNRILNSQMQIAQRATSATITAGSTIAAGYSTVDRFYVYCTGANVTAAQVAGSGATKNRLQITGAASVTAVGIGQRIEQLNSYDLAGSTATLSCDISNSLLTSVTWTAYYANTADTFGTLASPTRTQIATGTFTVTSTVTNYSTNISVPAAATTGIEILFTVGAQTSGTWVIGNIQLEKGSTATSFDYRPYGTELGLCQRYFYQRNGTGYFSACYWQSATQWGGCIIQYPVTMRTAPTFTFASASNFSVGIGGSSIAAATITASSINQDSANVNGTVASGGTIYAGGTLFGGASSSIAMSAEL